MKFRRRRLLDLAPDLPSIDRAERRAARMYARNVADRAAMADFKITKHVTENHLAQRMRLALEGRPDT